MAQATISPLKESEDARLFSRIERNIELLRRDGQAAGTLSGWGELLVDKFRSVRADRSDLTPAQAATMESWLAGTVAGRVAMIDFLNGERLVRQNIDPFSLCASIGLGSVLNTEWLYKNVFSRPPQVQNNRQN